MDDKERLTTLRNELVGLYPNGADIERVLHDAGVDRTRIAFDGSPTNTWHAALVEAQRQGLVASVAAVATREYPRSVLSWSQLPSARADGEAAPSESVGQRVAKALLAVDAHRGMTETIRILLVEDEDNVRLAMCRLIEEAFPKVTVHTANDGRPALSILESQPVDLVITDLMMPGMTGAELILAMQRRFPETPAILYSAFYFNPKFSVPHAGFFDKPVDLDLLFPYVHRVVHGELSQLLRSSFGYQPVVLRSILRCQDKIRAFLAQFNSAEILETALRHKLKECVYHFSRALSPSAAVNELSHLERQIDKLLGVARRTHHGVATGFAQYIQGIGQDFVDDHPALKVTVRIDETSVGLCPASSMPFLVLAVTELLDNARDALAGQGEIRVTARARASEPALCIRVWSSKPIPPALAPRIFDEGVSTKGEGRGMGLALVQAMVLRVGGTVRLVQHDGAEFVLDFPTPRA